MSWRIGRRWAAVGLGLTLAAACGQDPVTSDPAVAPFVGTWDADSLTMTSDANTTLVVNILDIPNASFFIVVEPSGQYTATLALPPSAPFVEVGQLTVIGSTIRLDPSVPPGDPATSAYVFTSEDHLVLDGPSEFDFNLDLTPEPAQAHFELQRR